MTKIDADLTEALERWHNTNGFSTHDESECFEAVYSLAAAYATEHPEDDNEPITEDWLRSSVGAVDSKWHSCLVIYVSSQLVIRCGEGFACVDGQMKPCCTRGQVRRLITVLRGH